MKLDDALTLLQNIKFLHYRFRASNVNRLDGHFTLDIIMEAPDTRDRTVVFSFTHSGPFPNVEYFNREEFIRLVYERVLKVLQHEAAELFKVNDIDVFNEHEHHQIKDKLNLINKMYEREQQSLQVPMDRLSTLWPRT